LKEFQKLARLLARVGALRQQRSRGVAQIPSPSVQSSIGEFDVLYDLARVGTPPQAHDVETEKFIALRAQTKRRHILRNPRPSADHRALADPAVLVYDGAPADKGMVSDLHMAAEEYGICHDHALADPTVMCNMGGSHDEAIGANLGKPIFARRAIDRDVLANNGARADSNAGMEASVETQILRRTAQHGKRVHLDFGLQDAMSADHRMGVYDAGFAELSAILHQRGGMDFRSAIDTIFHAPRTGSPLRPSAL
jgi:hypothetical protein